MGFDLREPLFKVANLVHPAIIRVSGGRLGGRVAGMPVVVLTTTGRKSGQARTTPLTAIEHEGRTYIVASKGGDEHHPAWYLNLVANPDVTVQRGGRTEAMTARVLTPDERAEVWPIVTRTYKGYAGYQRRTDREIPVIELVTAGAGAAAGEGEAPR
jgi:deazaflavin-dependent oxidoreductase (nitroreductase family)